MIPPFLSYEAEQSLIADRLREPQKYREPGPTPNFRHPAPAATWRILELFKKAGVRPLLPNILEVVRASEHPRRDDLESFVIQAADQALHPTEGAIR